MRFADIAIDLAAVISASRSVASRHVALRSRQINVYTKTSGLAASVKAATTQAQQGVENVLNTRPDAASDTKTNLHAAPPASDYPTPSQKLSSSAEQTPGAPSSDIGGLFSQGAFEFSKSLEEKQRRDPELPADVDVNIFHTSRGSQILEARKRGLKPATSGSRQIGLASKEHPLRNWPNRPPIDINGPPRESKPETSAPELNVADESPAIPMPTAAVPLEPQAELDTETTKTRVDEDDIAQLARDLTQEVAPPPIQHALRESKVPSSRMGRLWNYGGLAAGMLGGAMTESIGRALGSGGQGSVLLSEANMERMVSKLSRMRGAALKIGQQLSFQDSKMLPAPIQQVLQRVQDRADYMPAWQRDRVLVSNLGNDWRELFSEFEETPIAAASIGQVHKARLKSNGKKVAVKIQFPGVADSINSDLDNLGILLTATKLLPKGLYLNKTIDNARTELAWECDYEREAECVRRYKELLEEEQDIFTVPDVHAEASGKQVLTMDFMEGVGVTRVTSFTQEQKDWIGSNLLRLCLREIAEFQFMQTDPNWTNFLYNEKLNKLELLDFGASREYPDKFVSLYVQVLEAASRSDRPAVKELSEKLGYLTGHESKAMLDAHVNSVLTLAEPFSASAPEVYDFQDQTITERVKALIPVMLRERLSPPPEETYSLHRKLSGAFLLCSRLGSKVACREMFQNSVRKSGYVPGK